MPTADELQQTIKGYATGMIKGNTADLLGTPVDIVNLAISPVTKALGIYTDTPFLGSKDVRQRVGFEVDDKNMAETAGSLISLGGLSKAMIVGAARLGKVDKAIDAEKAAFLANETGLKQSSIYNLTGAYKDTDNGLKAVIPDNKSRVNLMTYNDLVAKPDQATASLPDFLQHPELHSLYPELSSVNVILSKMDKNQLGGYNKGTKTLYLNSELSPTQLRDVVLHETQHVVQGIEGFARGGSVGEFLPSNFNAKKKAIQSGFTRALESGDQATIAAAERAAYKLNETRAMASTRYENLAGEQEARFTQMTKNMGQQDIAANVLNILRNGKTPSNAMTQELPKVLSLQERINLIPGNK